MMEPPDQAGRDVVVPDDGGNLPTMAGPPVTPWRAPSARRPRTVRLLWRRRGVRLAAGTLLLAALAGVALALVRGGWLYGDRYTYAQVRTGNLILTVAASGAVQAQTYDVSFAGPGRVTEIDVSVGQTVRAGQVLARQDTTLLQDDLKQAQASLAAARAATSAANNNLAAVDAQTSAAITAARMAELNMLQNVCPRALNRSDCVATARATYAAAIQEAQVQQIAAQSALALAQAQVGAALSAEQSARDALAGATLLAPHSGAVALVGGAVGASPGQAGTPFIRIVDLSALQVVAEVGEDHVVGLRPGQPVSFTVGAYAGQTFHGTVTSVAPSGRSGPGGTTFPVTVAVDMSGLAGASLLPGMAAHLVVTPAARFGILLVPASALRFAQAAADPRRHILTLTEVNAASAVATQEITALQAAEPALVPEQLRPAFLLERQGDRWVVQPVVLGLTNGADVEVIWGLSRGQRIVAGAPGGL
jgi:HlyD family secretion protein